MQTPRSNLLSRARAYPVEELIEAHLANGGLEKVLSTTLVARKYAIEKYECLFHWKSEFNKTPVDPM
jgi:hypothetical protein